MRFLCFIAGLVVLYHDGQHGWHSTTATVVGLILVAIAAVAPHLED